MSVYDPIAANRFIHSNRVESARMKYKYAGDVVGKTINQLLVRHFIVFLVRSVRKWTKSK